MATEKRSPFSVVALTQEEQQHLAPRLAPTTRRTKSGAIVAVDVNDIEFLEDEFLVKRLTDIQSHLWLAGLPIAPRPLHHQVVNGRQIVVSESMELHLVWHDNLIYLKPLPAYLLFPNFWETHLLAGEDERTRAVAACALGFLFTYCALVASLTDFRLAQQTGLLPTDLSWDNWRELTSQTLARHEYSAVNPRFWYGELRLGRLNMIYRLSMRAPFRGYSSVGAHSQLGDLLRDNFAALGTVLAYVVIVLTAMQVGLATTRLQNDVGFQRASYGFTVLSILAPLGAGAGILLLALWRMAGNLSYTLARERKRFDDMGVHPPWEAKAEAEAAAAPNV